MVLTFKIGKLTLTVFEELLKIIMRITIPYRNISNSSSRKYGMIVHTLSYISVTIRRLAIRMA